MKDGDTDFGALLPDMARLLYQDRTIRERGDDIRVGRHGSLVVRMAGDRAVTWHDFELNESGDTLKLIERELRCSRATALRWLEDARQLVPSAPRTDAHHRQSSSISRPDTFLRKPAQETSAHSGPWLDRGDRGGIQTPHATTDVASAIIAAALPADDAPARRYLVDERWCWPPDRALSASVRWLNIESIERLPQARAGGNG